MLRVFGLSAIKYLKHNGSIGNLLPISSLNYRGLKIYTKTGDKGKSSLFNGQRRPKTDPIFDALGTIDELSSSIGIAYGHITDVEKNNSNKSNLLERLLVIQSRLQDIGACVATPIPGKAPRSVSFSPEAATLELESWIDEMTHKLPPLTQFILPSGGKASASLHFSRSICRRAERNVLLLNDSDPMPKPIMIYLNRLSDYLFTAARFACLLSNETEKYYVTLSQE